MGDISRVELFVDWVEVFEVSLVICGGLITESFVLARLLVLYCVVLKPVISSALTELAVVVFREVVDKVVLREELL